MSKLLKPSDIEFFTSISQVSINSPTGTLVAFTATKPSLNNNDYLSWIEVLDIRTGEKVFVSQGNKDLLPRWSPSGDKLYFISISSDGGKFQLIEHLFSKGSRVRLVLDKPIRDYKVCNDDVVYAMIQDLEETPDPDYVYTDKLRIWHDGAGFIHNMYTRLYKVDLQSGLMEPVTSSEQDVLVFDINRECTKGVLAIAERDKAPFISKLYYFDPVSTRTEPLLDGVEHFVMGISIDDSIAALAAHRLERGLTSHLRLLIIDLNSREEVLYDKPKDRAIGGVVYNDVVGPAFSLPKPRVLGDKVYFTLSDGGRNSLYAWDKISGYRELLIDDSVILDFDVNKEYVVYTRSNSTTPIELYFLSLSSMNTWKLTNYNKWLSQYKLSRPIHFSFKASDGAVIEGWVMEPVDKRLEINGKSPAILEIHGGPKNKYGYSFMFEYQLLASTGFYVIYLNPRGSDGYGEDFADIRHRYGERDFQDIMEGIDYVLEKWPGIDPERLGVAGISYGGFMTNWIITHSDKFKAAISEDGISTWLGEYGVADIGFVFVPDQIGGTPFNNPEVLEKKSPVYYAHRVKTPVLFIHGLNDYRCYVEQALVMYTTLRHLGKEAAIALFKDSPHAFSMIGKPRSRLKRYQLIINWFEKYLGKTK